MIAYFYFSFVFLPLLSPLRNLGVLEPGLIRNALLPPLFIALVFSIGLGKILKPRRLIQYVLAGMFLLAGIIGAQNLVNNDSFREYFSHLFQAASAYVLFLVGWITFKAWSEKFWKYFILLSLVSTIISSAFTIGALERGDIGRYYTAAYGFILIAAYSANASNSITLFAILGSIVSNKRAVALAVFTLFFTKVVGLSGIGEKKLTYRSLFLSSLKAVLFVLFSAAVVVLFVSWVNQNPSSGIGKAYNISINRIADVFDALQQKSGIEEASSGRFQEIETALDSMSGSDYLFGNGAGWEITLNSGKEVQNIHFTPLSLVSVYGIPVTVLFYFSIIVIYLKFLILKCKGLSLTEKIAPLYVVGAIVHSFFAYSLFIDWLFFFFVGVLARSVQVAEISRRVVRNA
ncbi:hypothetical protein [Marinobacter salsuginis]|uniref:hypothetical protein n=1 Tax=Marinobacter salsuginis TaxID=418719 RepID=UPI00273F6A0F|nr:hypothetical protein [Marinobacter salsuginis]